MAAIETGKLIYGGLAAGFLGLAAAF